MVLSLDGMNYSASPIYLTLLRPMEYLTCQGRHSIPISTGKSYSIFSSLLIAIHVVVRSMSYLRRGGKAREPPGSEFIFLVINSKLLYSGNAVPLIEQAR